jgi:hypothetical protein
MDKSAKPTDALVGSLDKKILTIALRANQMYQESSEPLIKPPPKPKPLPEDVYYTSLESLISRDFFPENPTA